MKQQQYPLYPLPFSAPLDASRNYDIVRATFFQGQQFFGCVRGDSALLKHINLDLYEQDALILEGIQLAQRTYATVSCMEFLPAQLFDDLCLAVFICFSNRLSNTYTVVSYRTLVLQICSLFHIFQKQQQSKCIRSLHEEYS